MLTMIVTITMKKLKSGEYEYRGYIIKNLGYYPPDHCVWWEASIGGEGAFHSNTKRDIKRMIDEWEEKIK